MEENKKFKKIRKTDMIIIGRPNAVRVVNNNIEAALRFWKRNMKDNGKIEWIKENREYTKPTVKRRELRNQAFRAEWTRRQQQE
jgi:ribosomal protein S21